MRRLALVLLFGTFPCSGFSPLAAAQSPTATVNGQVRDASGAVLPDADVQLIEDRTNVRHATRTNKDGIYSLTDIPPGNYHLQVSKTGFKTLVKPDIVLNVLDARVINFDLPIGADRKKLTRKGKVRVQPKRDTETQLIALIDVTERILIRIVVLVLLLFDLAELIRFKTKRDGLEAAGYNNLKRR